ncbi:hypothetical protein SRHO_G00179430 [Serrasalmus rhombeus]
MSRNIIHLWTWVTAVLLTIITNSSDTNLATATVNDPCDDYTPLDQPWRATNATQLLICDSNFNWNGWYRLLYYGMSVRMADSCVNEARCGTYATLWLNGPHPQIEDGIITLGVCGSWASNCCYFRSTQIRVKACPGNYTVYEFVRPNVCTAAYCADVNTIIPTNPLANGTSSAVTPQNITYDPCNISSVVDNTWRSVSSGYSGFDDTLVEWSGWYRLNLQGKIAQIPESDWCWSSMTCGGYTALLLGGSHPRLQDGIVTREIYGSNGGRCSSQKSNSIQVKACPGNYYVYRLVKPAVSIPMPTYCAEDGIVTRGVCGRSGTDYCYFGSTPIRVKACPGKYYVYEFVRTLICNAAYCAAATSININSDPCNVSSVLDNTWRSVSTGFSGYDDTVVEWNGWYRLYLQGRSAQMPERVFYSGYVSCGGYSSLLLEGPHPLLKDGVVTRDVYGSNPQYISYKSNPIQVKACPGNYYVYRLVKPAVSLPMPTYCAVAFNTPSYDPCNSYTFLDQPWRGTNETGGSNCDYFYGNVWYRLLYKGMSVRMPESCVNRSRCGTDVGLWLNGSHPQIEDGIITRGVCGNSGSDCCFYRSYPIRVKACPGNYYVYEFVGPNSCYLAYCADITLLTPAAETPVPNITVATECKDNFTPKCGEDLFNQLENITAQVLPPQVVVKYLDMVLNTQEQLLKVETASPEKMASYGNTVLNRTEKLVSTLVKPTETTDSVNISRNGLDIQVFAVGPKASLNEIPQLRISSTQMDIDLIQISKNNDGSAAAAFMSFSNMASMLKPNFFNTTNNTVKTMMSIVVSATLPKTTNMQLPRPVNFTLEHIESDPLLELLNTVAVAVGLFFLSLSLLTFALCHQHMRVNLTPLINLCISLFLAHLLFLLTQTFLQYMRTNPLLCAVLAGVLHFLFLSAFVWMFFEAVLLLISVKNLKKIQSKQKEVLSWKCLIVIGYVIPLIVVGVSIGLFHDGYGSEQILIFKTLIQIVILGCPWILGFFVNGSKVLGILFLFLNSQQGTFIFLVHCVLNQEWCHMWGCSSLPEAVEQLWQDIDQCVCYKKQSGTWSGSLWVLNATGQVFLKDFSLLWSDHFSSILTSHSDQKAVQELAEHTLLLLQTLRRDGKPTCTH